MTITFKSQQRAKIEDINLQMLGYLNHISLGGGGGGRWARGNETWQDRETACSVYFEIRISGCHVTTF